MAFRGIGDAATQVIKDQNQLGMEAAQLSETARQFDARLSEQRASRAESAKQFQATQAANAAQTAEQTRQFDVSAQQKQAGAAEQTRQFEVSRQDELAQRAAQAGRQTLQDERQYGLDLIKADLDMRTSEAGLKGMDAENQLKYAQLKQYTTAADEEARQRKNREDAAIRTFVGLGFAAGANGGTIPVKAGEIAGKEIGAKAGVQGFTDFEGDGYTYIRIPDENGQIIEKKISPGQMYLAAYQQYGKDYADSWKDLFVRNQTALATIAKAQADAQAKSQPSARDRMTMITNFNRYADAEAKKMETDYANRAQHEANAKMARDAAARLTESALKEETGEKSATPTSFSSLKDGDPAPAEIVKQYGLPPDARIYVDPRSGEKSVKWREGGRYMSRKFVTTSSEEPAAAEGASASPFAISDYAAGAVSEGSAEFVPQVYGPRRTSE